jgi:hypothetical protein
MYHLIEGGVGVGESVLSLFLTLTLTHPPSHHPHTPTPKSANTGIKDFITDLSHTLIEFMSMNQIHLFKLTKCDVKCTIHKNRVTLK